MFWLWCSLFIGIFIIVAGVPKYFAAITGVSNGNMMLSFELLVLDRYAVFFEFVIVAVVLGVASICIHTFSLIANHVMQSLDILFIFSMMMLIWYRTFRLPQLLLCKVG